MRHGKKDQKGADPRGLALEAQMSGIKAAKGNAIPDHIRKMLNIPAPTPSNARL